MVEYTHGSPYSVHTMRGDTLVAMVATATSDRNGAFELKNLPMGPGWFRWSKLMMDSIGDRDDETLVELVQDQALALNLSLPKVCPWTTENNRSGVCPICRKMESVTPIVYSYPTGVLFEKARQGELVLGECIVDEYCQPRWYCKRDEKEF